MAHGEQPIGDAMPALVGGGARGKALYCCRNMSAAFKPPQWPHLPAALSVLGRQRLIEIREADRHGAKPFDERETHQRQELREWDMAQAFAETDSASRLRGAFWCVVTLRAVLLEDPSDTEADEMLGALERYLSSEWGVDAVPAELIERTAIAREMARHLRKHSR